MKAITFLPCARAAAIVLATKNYNDPAKVAQASRGIGMGMPGLDIRQIPEAAVRGSEAGSHPGSFFDSKS